MKVKLPRIMFAAANSGSGKTTITCAVLKALLEEGTRPAAFKCGPDYIDPMFHTEVIGAKSRNLDLFLTSEQTCRYLLAKNSKGADLSVLEGVMGFYDGLSGGSTTASSYHLAKATDTPVILIVSCKGAFLSVAAVIKGFAEFRKDSNIQGVILNHTSKAMYQVYQQMIERETGIKVVGYFPTMKDCQLESRHLGLITASEIDDLQEKVSLLAEQAKSSVDLKGLMEIANRAPELEHEAPSVEKKGDVRIAVARDKAFCFYYQDSLELLEEMGAKLIPFSPLADSSLPQCDGLILGGGYPELYGRELSENQSMRESIRTAVNGGLPTIAECGGFMYLLDSMQVRDGKCYPMAGVISGSSFMTERLNRFGYITLTAEKNHLLSEQGEQINGHEFHYSDSTSNGSGFVAEKPVTGRKWNCIHGTETLFAGYPHIHLWGNPDFACRFIVQCNLYKEKISFI